MSLAGNVLGPYFNVSSEIDTGSSTRETFNFFKTFNPVDLFSPLKHPGKTYSSVVSPIVS